MGYLLIPLFFTNNLPFFVVRHGENMWVQSGGFHPLVYDHFRNTTYLTYWWLRHYVHHLCPEKKRKDDIISFLGAILCTPFPDTPPFYPPKKPSTTTAKATRSREAREVPESPWCRCRCWRSATWWRLQSRHVAKRRWNLFDDCYCGVGDWWFRVKQQQQQQQQQQPWWTWHMKKSEMDTRLVSHSRMMILAAKMVTCRNRRLDLTSRRADVAAKGPSKMVDVNKQNRVTG